MQSMMGVETGAYMFQYEQRNREKEQMEIQLMRW